MAVPRAPKAGWSKHVPKSQGDCRLLKTALGHSYLREAAICRNRRGRSVQLFGSSSRATYHDHQLFRR